MPGNAPVNAGRTRVAEARQKTFICTTATLPKLTDEDGSELLFVTNAKSCCLGMIPKTNGRFLDVFVA
jgi:hypothetical protein